MLTIIDSAWGKQGRGGQGWTCSRSLKHPLKHPLSCPEGDVRLPCLGGKGGGLQRVLLSLRACDIEQRRGAGPRRGTTRGHFKGAFRDLIDVRKVILSVYCSDHSSLIKGYSPHHQNYRPDFYGFSNESGNKLPTLTLSENIIGHFLACRVFAVLQECKVN